MENKHSIIINGVMIKYNEECITILDSYKVKGREMRKILEGFKVSTGYKSRRSMESWIREWRSHNFLYRLGLYRSHTKDCDLEEDIDLWHRIIYWILG